MTHPLLAILNSFWQSAAIAAAVWLALRLARGTNAATRHALWWTVLALALLLPGVPADRNVAAPRPIAVFRAVEADAPYIPVGPRYPIAARAPRPRGIQLPSGDWPAMILSAWAFVCFLQFARVGWSYWRLRALKRDARPADDDLRRSFDAWVLACRIKRPVRLLISSKIASPIALGFRRPAVLLPESLLTEFQEADLDHVLLHELAHIARRDDWTNLAARLATGVFAFHPVALWLVRQIDREREIACDDWVVSMTGAARPYAASLTRLFELCHARNRLALATGMATRASNLGERVERLLRARHFFAKTSLVKVGFACAAMIAAGLAFSQTPRFLAIAQERPHRVSYLPEAPQAPEAPEAQEAPEAPPALEAAGAPDAPDAPDAPEAPDAPPTPDAPKGGYLAGLVAAGYGDLSVDEIINLKNSGVDPAYIAAMSRAGWGRVDPRQLVDLHNNGVPPDWARAIHESGIRNVSFSDLVHLRQNGVDPENIRRIHELGFGPFEAREVIQLQNHAVNSELFRAFRDAGWKNLALSDVIEAQQNGLNARSLREARQFGASLTLKQIIRLQRAGVI